MAVRIRLRRQGQPLAQPLERLAAVLRLAAPLGGAHRDPGGAVGQPDAALGLVAVLPAGAD